MVRGKKGKRQSEKSSLSSVLTGTAVRQMAGPAYFERGKEYFESGLVENLIDFEERITARVYGTAKYDVSLWPERGGVGHSCTCPLGQNGEFCKHCVAVGLAWLNRQKEQGGKSSKSKKGKITFEDVRDYLLAEEKQALVEIVLEQARRDDRLRQRLLARTARACAEGLDLDSFRSSIDLAVQTGGFVDYRSAWDYISGIDEIIDAIEELLDERYAKEVIELAEYALTAVEGVMEQVDDSDGGMGSILDRLQEIHLQACKQVKQDPEELARKLFQWELDSDWDVFHAAAETYAQVLGKKGLAVYRELTEKEWEQMPRLTPESDERGKWGRRYSITSMMESLARQAEDMDELVRIKSRDLSTPYRFLEIAEIYRNARQREKALEWAEQGLKSFPTRPDPRLREFLANEYHRLKRHDEAMSQIWAIFAESPGLERYRLLKAHADKVGAWSIWREKALSLVRKQLEKAKKEERSERWLWYPRDNSELVRIFLWEKDVEAAWREAQEGGCSNDLWHELAKKREKEYPEDAVDAYKQLVEPALERKKNSDYKDAVGFIERINRLMSRIGKKREFDEYLESVRATHKRKRNFIKLLEKAKLP